MADESLFKRLSRLFSTNVIIRQVDGKLQTTDTERIQSYSDLATNFMKSRGLAYFHSTAARYGYDIMANISAQRVTIFRDYELMEQDPLIASALDIYADECSVKDEFGNVLAINSDNEKVKDALQNLFYDIMNIKFNIWPWIRNMCKYGDHFLKLEIAEKYGIINVIPISAYEVQREEGFDPDNPYRVRFVLQQVAAENRNLESYELAHFRMLSDTNFLPYGKSVIEPARRVWKQIMLMEDAMLIHRIMRAPEKRIFRVDVGNVAPNEVETFMKNMINKIKKTPYVDPRTGEYNLKFNMMNMTEDFFIPVRGGDSGTSIDTLAGLEYNAIDDINYLLNKLLAALKVPKAFLGYEEGIGGKATLAAEDVRFARTIERIQRIFLSELYKIAVVHLYVQGFKDEEITNFTLELTNPSTILEQERISLWQEKVSLTRDMLETKMFDKDWIYKNVWKFTDSDVKERGEKVLKDIKTLFRLNQIENEGNDPFITNQTFGTAHDLAVLQQRAKEGTGVEPKKIDFNAGESNTELNYNEHDDVDRTEQEDSYGEQNHIDGKDPLGGRGATSAPKHDMDIKHKYKGSPLSMESIDNKNKELFKTRYGLNIIDKKYKSKNIVLESLKSDDESKNSDSEDSGSFLDEKNLLDM